MLNKKYVGDYRLENMKDKKGKVVTKPVYKGTYYVFEKPADKVRSEVRLIAAFTLLAILFFVLAVAFYSNKGFSAQYYTLVPFLVCVFPLLYLAIAAFYLLKSGNSPESPVTRERKDKMHERLAKSSFVIMLLSGWNLCGIVLAYILKLAGRESRPVTVNDIVFSSASLFFFASIVLVFSRRKNVTMVPAAKGDN
ncbi:MAG: hypothetical protein J5950_02230 [Clostridia bacterium]|nr:hypothetical protein [Clostridia bacterium]